MIIQNRPLYQCAGIIGKTLGYYDKALFALIAPFIAQDFFPSSDERVSLINMYALLAMSLFTRPLGALFFGRFSDRYGSRAMLLSSLSGMAIITTAIGFLPSYSKIGICAPILLAFCRLMQNFFIAGESTGASLFVLEHTKPQNRTFMSSIIDSASLSGVLLASLFVALLGYFGLVSRDWRLLFWFSSLTALFGLFLRMRLHGPSDSVPAQKKELIGQTIRRHYKILIAMTCVAGLSHTTYAMAFTFMNGFVPFVTALTKEDMVQVNTWLLVLDMLFLPVFGSLATKYTKERLMLISAAALSILSVALFGMLPGASFEAVIFVRICIVVLGVCFAASYHAWAYEQVSAENRFVIVSLASAFGSQFIGAPSAAICLWLYTASGIAALSGLYLAVASLFALVSVYACSRTSRSVQIS